MQIFSGNVLPQDMHMHRDSAPLASRPELDEHYLSGLVGQHTSLSSRPNVLISQTPHPPYASHDTGAMYGLVPCQVLACTFITAVLLCWKIKVAVDQLKVVLNV